MKKGAAPCSRMGRPPLVLAPTRGVACAGRSDVDSLRIRLMRPTLLRRFVGTALLLLIPASAAEPVFGLVRDGVVHHESAAAAASHRDAGPQSGHGHEDSVPTHQHGTPADHCTHVHGVALMGTTVPLSFGAALSPQHGHDVVLHHGRSSLDSFHPPRA